MKVKNNNVDVGVVPDLLFLFHSCVSYTLIQFILNHSSCKDVSCF